ncbi:MAG: tRNA preQ1(34) S-adenosylmethionine ribosyltransferase-isomerase QueA [Verrucomicrobiota bacterium]
MDASLFDFTLPRDRIAQEPVAERDASKLMVIDRAAQSVKHTCFAKIAECIPRNTRFFRNNAAVLKARLYGRRPTGGKVECLLLQPAENATTWWCLIKPGKKTMQSGSFGLDGEYQAQILEAGKNGNYRVAFKMEREESVDEMSARLGTIPLPPYIERTENDLRLQQDNERYQTVYADFNRRVAVAAPTAGLHFTPKLIRSLEASGASFHDLTLRVGIGTFHPIQIDQIENHKMHLEWYRIPQTVLESLKQDTPGPRLAVGTTSVRSIEDAMQRLKKRPESYLTASGAIEAEADIFIYPPADFAAVDAMITNFHLPRSTLLCLVAAFLTPGKTDGIDWLKELYAEAIANNYRFYSYGDAMLIL